jgi:hypothetical protein
LSTAASADVDPQSFLTGLVEGVTRALGDSRAAAVLEIERDRSLGDRLSGRPGTIRKLRLVGSEETLTLGYERGPRWSPEIARVSGGVVISRRTVPLAAWLSSLAGRVAAIAADASGESVAAARALQAMGIVPAGSDVQVPDADIPGGLSSIAARVDGRIAPDAVAAVDRIAKLLADTLPRVVGSGEPEVIVRRAATAYLPDTLRAYLALPSDWSTSHVFADGTTPAQALTSQLATLEAAVTRMRDSAVEQDASALLVNGKFLSERFAVSSLDLG